MTPSARVQAAIDILDQVVAAARDNGPPADRVLSDWFKTRRFVGSKDRRAVREIVWGAIRAHGDLPRTAREAVASAGQPEWRDLFDGSGYGPAVLGEREGLATPEALPGWFRRAAPDWLTSDEASALLGRAPLNVRVNKLRASVEAVMAGIPEAERIAGLPWGLTLPEMPGLEQHLLYRDGSIEVQDAGSQHVAQVAAARAGETVIDLCAGAGGKTLALAADMGGEGRLIACDTDRNRLGKLVPRASRAGAEDIATRLLDPQREAEALADLEGQADLVVIDAPCTGSGTWRRSPDLRWRMTPARAAQIVALQAHILGVAEALVKPGGRLVYAVCSVRDAEGATQIAPLAKRWTTMALPEIGRARGAGRLLTPFHDNTDGFFVAVLRKPC